jgi:DNA modification methylase
MRPKLLQGDVLGDVWDQIEDNSIQCVVTSPPYWGLRDYGDENQLGLEPTPEQYAYNLVKVFRKIREKLKDDGTVWLNIGDSYHGSSGGGGGATGSDLSGKRKMRNVLNKKAEGVKPKDLVGIPWLVAFALRDDGWYLRSDIIWAKPNPIPESVKDRPTRAHEMIFLFTKKPDYFYDYEAAREELLAENKQGSNKSQQAVGLDGKERKLPRRLVLSNQKGKNSRTVWFINIQPLRNAHIAVFPQEIPERCIKAGTRPGDIVLDPFSGSGTTCLVASRLGRNSIGIELNEDFLKLSEERCYGSSQSLEDFL